MKKFISLLIISLFCLTPSFAQLKMQKTKVLLVADASHSMIKNWTNRSKIDVSRIALARFVDKCKEYGEIELALRVYGSQSPASENNCKDSKLEEPFAIGNSSKIKIKLNKLNPKGTSAVAYALEQLVNDFPEEDFHKKVVVFLTDGADACSGNVCDAYNALIASGKFKGIYIVGLDLNEEEKKGFECIDGFVNVSTEQSLKSTLDRIFGEIKPY